MNIYKSDTIKMYYKILGNDDAPVIIWAHGWGQSHASFLQLIQPFENTGKHIAIDFPGFGQSTEPNASWNTKDYADFIASFLHKQKITSCIWIGHSFGCRVGLQIASHYPDLIQSMCLIAGAGLPRQRSLFKKTTLKARVLFYKTCKKLIPIGLNEEWLKRKFGSADYASSSPTMRSILINVINENLSAQAQNIKCPVTLIYGENDEQTPPEIGRRLNTLIPDSQMVHLTNQDHYTVLQSGRHQVAPYIKKIIKKS